jgi:hypothetical protein
MSANYLAGSLKGHNFLDAWSEETWGLPTPGGISVPTGADHRVRRAYRPSE